METNIKITDGRKFVKIDDIDTSNLRSAYLNYRGFKADGSLYIRLTTGEEIHVSGEFGQHDYEEEYGFIFEPYETE